MNLFVDKNVEIKVTLYVLSKDNKSLFWTKNNTKNKPENVTEDSESVKLYNLSFRLPNYKDTVDLIDSGIQFSSDGGMQISTGSVSFGRFTRLLKSWDLVDQNGEPVVVNAENIGNLDPGIAKCIIEDLESQLLNF